MVEEHAMLRMERGSTGYGGGEKLGLRSVRRFNISKTIKGPSYQFPHRFSSTSIAPFHFEMLLRTTFDGVSASSTNVCRECRV